MADAGLLVSGTAILYERDHSDPSRLTFVSQEVTEKLGYAPRLFADDPDFWSTLVHPDDAATVSAELSLLPNAKRTTIQYRLRASDGSFRVLHDEAKVLWSPDGTPRIVGSLFDITQWKALEKENDRLSHRLGRANRELEQFAYVASHDLRAPLRAIDTLSEWLEHDLGEALQGEAREQMRLLRGRVRRMDHLLADLLEYARIGRVPVVAELTDPTKLLREVVDLLQIGGILEVAIPSPLPQLVTAKAPLKRVFLNLLSNAAKHHDRGKGRVEVRCRDVGDFFQFSFADDGPGIAPEFHERVFQMFQTLKPRDVMEGSGMGLALVRRIVELSGGRVEIDGSGGRGTTFKLTWPKEWVDTTPTSQKKLPVERRAGAT